MLRRAVSRRCQCLVIEGHVVGSHVVRDVEPELDHRAHPVELPLVCHEVHNSLMVDGNATARARRTSSEPVGVDLRDPLVVGPSALLDLDGSLLPPIGVHGQVVRTERTPLADRPRADRVPARRRSPLAEQRRVVVDGGAVPVLARCWQRHEAGVEAWIVDESSRRNSRLSGCALAGAARGALVVAGQHRAAAAPPFHDPRLRQACDSNQEATNG